ncbi:T9SS type A sorting domain-containing protein [Draconibacterium sp. IB214405]|uniref:T9SS type A sorting domain-containing protein n=1 Tax=Draconibacterium sp. IB214405 TaxID=3097352 RepID=UPI002A1464FF|nr:T9SS type A sorting domain-containing protein [Draconibacterium sp. IB214405]MDX8341433.1 T9SS type A sorting domain-containing protein [Draconibacterium sp. IB214405]
MKELILCVCLVFLLSHAKLSFSQRISAEVISNSGAEFKTKDFSLNWTLGESVTDVLESRPYIHTQGFHQTFVTATDVETDITNPSVSVYPNPFRDFITVKLEDVNENVSVELFDASGKLLEFHKEVLQEEFRLNTTKYTEGRYLLRVNSDKTQTFGIIKSSN